MPGMNSAVNVNDPAVAAAFRAALLHQALIALLVLAAAGLGWLGLRARRPAAARDGSRAPVPAEPAGRRLIRVGFGLLWLLDGALQAQPGMAAGLPARVVEPVAASSPAWVRHVVNWAVTAWSQHPVQAGAAAVWIEAGLGIWLLAASRGAWSRLAGLASLGWALSVWVFGESFGGIFVPGLTWLAGAPGAALGYAVAGALIALPWRAWRTARLGRLTLAGTGLFLAGMAVLQAWPGRGFWLGTRHGQPGTLAGLVQSMASIPQPRFLSALVGGFGSVAAGHGFAVNLVAVAVPAVAGPLFLTGRPRLIRPALAVVTAACVADWVLIQDLGFLGGFGTDPGSMPPLVLLAVAGYLALARAPEAAAEPAGHRRGPLVGWERRVANRLEAGDVEHGPDAGRRGPGTATQGLFGQSGLPAGAERGDPGLGRRRGHQPGHH